MVSVRKLGSKMTRMRPVLTRTRSPVVNKRLKSLPSVQSAIPAGVDPTKVREPEFAARQ